MIFAFCQTAWRVEMENVKYVKKDLILIMENVLLQQRERLSALTELIDNSLIKI